MDVQEYAYYVHQWYTAGHKEFIVATTASRKRTHKHFQLDPSKIRRAQKALKAKTETETIERALDFTIAEHERNRLVWQATGRFLRSGIEIKDVFGSLER
jgi:hypothetical protein